MQKGNGRKGGGEEGGKTPVTDRVGVYSINHLKRERVQKEGVREGGHSIGETEDFFPEGTEKKVHEGGSDLDRRLSACLEHSENASGREKRRGKNARWIWNVVFCD